MPHSRKTSAALQLQPFITDVVMVLFVTGMLCGSSHAQTYSVLHNFSGPDGATPMAGVTADVAGNLYGTTAYGGSACAPLGCGTVYKLTRRGSGWILSTLYSFQGGTDGAYPASRLVFGPDGSLYGTTADGSGNSCGAGCGTVFRLRPPVHICASVSCPWTKTTLYRFTGGVDGKIPSGDLQFDEVGRIYGVTRAGGTFGAGNVYRLTQSGGVWTNSVLYSFTGGQDGLDPAGVTYFGETLYGTTRQGGYTDPPDYYGAGVVFELTIGDPHIETVLYKFMDASDGAVPAASVSFEIGGGFYGTTTAGGGGNCSLGNYTGCGTVYEGSFFRTVYSFLPFQPGMAPSGPAAPVVVNQHDNNIYGTSVGTGAFGYGNVFQLTGGQFAYTSLHDFAFSDGAYPISSVFFDSQQNLYGTASGGGTSANCNGGCGVVWQITP